MKLQDAMTYFRIRDKSKNEHEAQQQLRNYGSVMIANAWILWPILYGVLPLHLSGREKT